MLWYKSWLETRWRFFIGLGLLLLSAGGIVFVYPQVMKLLPRASELDTSGELGQRIREGVELSRDYRGYIWSQWMRQNLAQMATFFTIGPVPRPGGFHPGFLGLVANAAVLLLGRQPVPQPVDDFTK